MDRVASQVNRTIWKRSERLVAALESKGMRVERAYLYGSHAKGLARRGSDIDIAVVSRNLTGDWLEDYCRLARIADSIDVRMEVIPFLPRDFRDENPLVHEIKTTGILLIGNGRHPNSKTRESSKHAR